MGRNLFWVATSPGVWSDSNNWALDPDFSGGEDPPTISDNAFFGYPNSGGGYATGSCTIDEDIYCLDLTVQSKFASVLDFGNGFTYTISRNFFFNNGWSSTGSYCVITGLSGSTMNCFRAIIASGPVVQTINPASTFFLNCSYAPYVGGFFGGFNLGNIDASGSGTFISANGDMPPTCGDLGNTINIDFGDGPTSGPIRTSIYGTFQGDLIFRGSPGVLLPENKEGLYGTFQGDLLFSGAIKTVSPITQASTPGGNTPISGLQYHDPTKFLFTVSGTPVDLAGSNPHYNLGNISVNYDGKQMTFSEIGSPTFGSPTWGMESEVELKMDLGHGLLTYFSGRIKERRHIGQNNAESIEYTALGYQNLTNECDKDGQRGTPQIHFPAGTNISSALSEMFTLASTMFDQHSIPSSIASDAFLSFSAYTNEDINISGNMGWWDGLRWVMFQEPGKKLFYDDTIGQWKFVNVYDTNIYSLNPELVNFDEISYAIDTKGRSSAVELVTNWDGGGGSINLVFDRKVAIYPTPDWEPAFEDEWTVRKGMGLDGAAAFGDNFQWVFRRWKYEEDINPHATIPERFWVLIWVWKRLVWVPWDAVIDFKNKVVVTKVPVCPLGNAHIPGAAKGPVAVAITYWDFVSMPIPSGGGGAGSSTLRYPESGGIGSANQYGQTCVKKVEVEPNNFNLSYAATQLDAAKDVGFSADIPISGDPIHELLILQCQITVSHPTKDVGMGSLTAWLQNYQYDFGKPGKSTLSFTNEKDAINREAQ